MTHADGSIGYVSGNVKGFRKLRDRIRSFESLVCKECREKIIAKIKPRKPMMNPKNRISKYVCRETESLLVSALLDILMEDECDLYDYWTNLPKRQNCEPMFPSADNPGELEN